MAESRLFVKRRHSQERLYYSFARHLFLLFFRFPLFSLCTSLFTHSHPSLFLPPFLSHSFIPFFSLLQIRRPTSCPRTRITKEPANVAAQPSP